MDTKGLQKEFINWCKSNNKSPKSEDETKLLFVAFMKEKHPEEYKQALLNQLNKAKKAAHGAKLNYFKSLKNQCAEDEEVVYYKRGGSVGCGCKKKEDGGSIEKKDSTSNNAVKAFKLKLKQKKEQKRLDPKTTKTLPEGKYPSYWTSQERRTWEKIHGDNDEGLGAHEKGGKVNKDCGGAVAKFKMHRKGGSLNGIPFYLGGTPEGGIQSMAELIPIYGTYKAGQRFFRNPSWRNAGEFALSGLGDAAMLTGIGAGAGMALKAGNMAAKAGKVAKAASNLQKVKAARNLKYGLGYIGQYTDDAMRTASNLGMEAATYGGDVEKATNIGSKLIKQSNWADGAANTYRNAEWTGAGGLQMGINGVAFRGTNRK